VNGFNEDGIGVKVVEYKDVVVATIGGARELASLVSVDMARRAIKFNDASKIALAAFLMRWE
jgi:hypothetical protein